MAESYNTTEFKLELKSTYAVEEFVAGIVCFNYGKKAAVLNYCFRKIFIIDSENGSIQCVQLGHHSNMFENKKFDDNQRGALFNYKQGFGVIYKDMVFLFEDPNTIDYKLVPISNPIEKILNTPGIPQPDSPLISFYNEETKQLYVIFDEVQRRNFKTFFSVIKFNESNAQYDFFPTHFQFPEDHPEYQNLFVHNAANNNPVINNFLIYNNQFCISAYGRSLNMGFGKTPFKMYFSSLSNSYKGKVIIDSIENRKTDIIFSSDFKFIGWQEDEKGKRETILYSLVEHKYYRINLKSKKNDFSMFSPKSKTYFNLYNEYYWHSDGRDRVSCYKIKNYLETR